MYDHELTFTDIFDETIYANCPASSNDTDGSLKAAVQDAVSKLQIVLSAQTGIRVISSFVDGSNVRLKITVYNGAWVPVSP